MSEPMSDENLDVAERLSVTATKGPWDVSQKLDPTSGQLQADLYLYLNENMAYGHGIEMLPADAHFIRFARSFVPEAVKEIRALRAQAKADEEAMQKLYKEMRQELEDCQFWECHRSFLARLDSQN